MGILKEFKEFALRGNVVDLAVAVIIGAAFGSIVTSLVNDVMMPPLGAAMNGVDFGDKKVLLKERVPEHVNEDGETVKEKPAVYLSYGKFINAAVHFVIVAFCVFLLVKGINTLKRGMEKEGEPAAPTQKDCPHCFSSINIKATRCPQCTSELEMAAVKS
jgi:large conductance mechanosensitive channel